MGKHRTKNPNWTKEDRRTVARKLAGAAVWVSTTYNALHHVKGTGNTYRREVQS